MCALWEDLRVSRGMTAQMNRRRERVLAGEKPLGWKVAFGSPAAMQRLETTGALVGFLMEKSLLPSGATVPVFGWSKPLAEPEIAVYMGRDLPAGSDRAAAKEAVAAIGPAIELVDSQFAAESANLERVISENIYHRHVIPGEKDLSRAGCVLDGLTAHIYKNGAEIETASPPKATADDLIDIVRHVADMAGAFGEGLRAGELIITGSLVTPISVEAGDEVVFRLDPIERVSVKFSAK